MLSPSPNFFQTKRSLSEIKAELLPAYFRIWAEKQTSEELVLADLNVGNGYETNGEKAAALQMLEVFQEAENGRGNEAKSLKLFLSDASKTNLQKLKQNLEIPEEEEAKLPENISLLAAPESQKTLGDLLQKVPGLVVADLFSYLVAEEMVSAALENLQTDLFLLFDIKKLEKTFLAANHSVFIRSFFQENLPEIQARYATEKSAKRREQLLTDAFSQALQHHGFFALRFRINAPGKTAGSTYLFLGCRQKATYFQAKEWLKMYSESQEDGVPLFGVNLNYQPSSIPGFSSFLNLYNQEQLTQELAGLKGEFHYKTIREVYEAHSIGKPYILHNYLAAFRAMRKAETVNLVDANNKKVPKATAEAVVFYRLHRKN